MVQHCTNVFLRNRGDTLDQCTVYTTATWKKYIKI